MVNNIGHMTSNSTAIYFDIVFTSQVKLQRRSENAVESSHVLKFIFDAEAKHVEAAVQASLRGTSQL